MNSDQPTTTIQKTVTMAMVEVVLGFFIGGLVLGLVIAWVIGPTPEFPSTAGALSVALVGALVAAIIGAWLRDTRFTN